MVWARPSCSKSATLLSRPTQQRTSARAVVTAAKKKKRRSGSDSSGSGSGSDSGGNAQRVQPGSLVSVRKQIRSVRAREAAEKQEEAKQRSAARSSRGGYNKKGGSAALSEGAARCRIAERRGRNDHADLRLVQGQRGTPRAPVLLVDGYNVAHAHASCKESIRAGDLEAARDALSHLLSGYAHAQAVEVIVVWDALGGATAANYHDPIDQQADREESYGGVRTVWARRCEADSYIVRAVAREFGRGARYVLVATNDLVEAELAAEEGAFTLPAEHLLQQLDIAARANQREAKAASLQRGLRAGAGGWVAAPRHRVVPAGFKCEADAQEAQEQKVDAARYYAIKAKQRSKIDELQEQMRRAGLLE